MGRIDIYPAPVATQVIPVARLRATTSRAATVDAWGATTFDVADDDNWGQWSIANPTRLYCRRAGLYDLSGGLAYSHNVTGSRGIGFRKNGTGGSGPNMTGTQLFDPNARGWSSTVMIAAMAVRLALGDYVELCNLTGAIATNVILEDGNPHFAWAYRGP